MRLVAGCIFVLKCTLRGLFMGDFSVLLVSTSPPMCGIAARVIGSIRRVPVVYWVMDVNPDQMVALGRMSEGAVGARLLERINRVVLSSAAAVVVLDKFMVDRVLRKVPPSANLRSRMHMLPPWPHDNHIDPVEHQNNPFREKHGLAGKFVVMYSGNHGYSTPVTTIIQAARELKNDSAIVFMFIGGGVGKEEVEVAIQEYGLKNVVSLPYQPLNKLRYSLSAADLHVVTVGNSVVGVVHPCKIYGAMAVARPILLVAPDPCHASDLVVKGGAGWQVQHGDVDGTVEVIRWAARADCGQLTEMGRRGRNTITREFSKDLLLNQFADVVEGVVIPTGPPRGLLPK